MDGWSTPVLVRELLTLYAQRRRCGAAAGDAVPRLSGVLAGRIAPLRSRPGGRRWRGWRRARSWRRAIRRVRRLRPSRSCLRSSEALSRGAERCRRARAGADAQHLDAGGLGDSAGPSDRARRRGVRGDGGGAAGGDRRHREHGGAVHQHAAAADQAAAGQAAVAICCGETAGAPVATDGAPASRAGRDPAARPAWASCSTRWWCSRTIRSTAPALRPRPAGVRLAPVQRARRDALSAEPDGAAGRAAAAAARLPARPVRSGER